MKTHAGFALGLLASSASANRFPAKSNTLGVLPKNILNMQTIECTVQIQAAECGLNTKNPKTQKWAAFRIDYTTACNHGGPYGACCAFDTAPPGPDEMEANGDGWMFYWDATSGHNPGPGCGAIINPQTGEPGIEQDSGKWVAGGDDSGPSLLCDKFGKAGDGHQPCPGAAQSKMSRREAEPMRGAAALQFFNRVFRRAGTAAGGTGGGSANGGAQVGGGNKGCAPHLQSTPLGPDICQGKKKRDAEADPGGNQWDPGNSGERANGPCCFCKAPPRSGGSGGGGGGTGKAGTGTGHHKVRRHLHGHKD